MNRKIQSAITALLLSTSSLWASSVAVAAPLAIVDGGGQLTGVSGLEVGGSTFNVAFIADTCAAAYGGSCADDATFDLSSAQLPLATQALFDFLFASSDYATNPWDETPSLVNGIDNGDPLAFIDTLAKGGTGGNSLATFIINYTDAAGDGQDLWNGPFSSDFSSADYTSRPDYTFAVFSAVGSTPVPLPAAIWLLIPGIAVLAAGQRRRRVRGHA